MVGRIELWEERLVQFAYLGYSWREVFVDYLEDDEENPFDLLTHQEGEVTDC